MQSKFTKTNPKIFILVGGRCPVPRSWIRLWLQRLPRLPHPGNTCFLFHHDVTHFGERIYIHVHDVAGGKFLSSSNSQTTHPEQWKTIGTPHLNLKKNNLPYILYHWVPNDIVYRVKNFFFKFRWGVPMWKTQFVHIRSTHPPSPFPTSQKNFDNNRL